jgi:hypothetical protein
MQLETGSPAGSGTSSPVGLWIFFVFLLINRGGHSKEPASISQLMEAGKATASVDPPLTMTFDWRRLQCPPTLTLFARLH